VAADEATLRSLARASGLSRLELRRYLQIEEMRVEALPAAVLAARLRRVRRLRRDLGLSFDAIAIILRLLDRIDALERPTRSRLTVRIVDGDTPAGNHPH
jgi:hypothetical protein